MSPKRKAAASSVADGEKGRRAEGGGAKKVKKTSTKTQPATAKSKKTASKKNASGTTAVLTHSNAIAAPLAKSKGNATALPKTGSQYFTVSKCREWFKVYQDPNGNDEIGPHGIERLCSDLGIGVFGVTALLLAFYLEEPQAGAFHYQNWEIAMHKLNVTSTEALKRKLPELNALLDDSEQLNEFYKYLFTFAKVSEQKSLDIDTAIELLRLFPSLPHAHKFTIFLQERSPVKVMNRDQWTSFLEFNYAVSDDLTGYDEMGAWPVLLDDYVSWRRLTDGNPQCAQSPLKQPVGTSEE